MEEIKLKATGIVRRIDDLGRVVVPKEIRRTLRIREGDPLEIFTDREGEIILKKYSPIGELGQFAKQYADSLAQTTGHIIAISDRDQFIAVAGSAKKDLISKSISHNLEEIIGERESVVASREDKNFIKITNEDDSESLQKSLNNVELEMEVQLGNAHMNLSEFLQLMPGDIIKLDRKITDPLDSYIAGKPYFRVKPGKKDDYLAVELIDQLEGES